MRKGKYSKIRLRARNRDRSLSKKERLKQQDRFNTIVENERELTRPPRVKRNGVEIDRNELDEWSE